jgi:hypothetical protein
VTRQVGRLTGPVRRMIPARLGSSEIGLESGIDPRSLSNGPRISCGAFPAWTLSYVPYT